MPQVSTNLLNKTIFGLNQNSTAAPPDSLSVRLTDLQRGTYVNINGVAWGLAPPTAELFLDAFDSCDLMILRNEIFDPDFSYRLQNAIAVKDVVFHDVIIREQKFNYRDFAEPIRLNDASNYLIVMAAPQDLAGAQTISSCSLTVRGEIVKDAPKIADEERR